MKHQRDEWNKMLANEKNLETYKWLTDKIKKEFHMTIN